MIQLRKYQRDLVRTVSEAFALRNRRLCVQVPTGGGKTIIAAEIVRRLSSRRVLYIVPSNEIFDQTCDKLMRAGIRPTPLKSGSKESLYGAKCVVAMSQTLARRLPNGILDRWQPDLVICDEAHRLLKQHENVLRSFNCASIALTATPTRLDGKSLADLWPCLIQGPQVYDLVSDDFLVPCRTLNLPLADLSGVRKRRGDYEAGSLSKAYENSRAADLSALLWQRHARGRPTIAFAPSKTVSQTLSDALSTLGARSVHLDGHTRKREREEKIEALRAGELDVITNCGLFVEGFDAPLVSCVLVCTSTLSLTKWLQMVGRGMRVSPETGKQDLLVLDHGACAQRLGLPDADRDWFRGGAPI